MQDIDREISERYCLNIKSIVPFRNEHIIITTSGRKILKNSRLHPGRLLFIHGGKEHLVNNDFI